MSVKLDDFLEALKHLHNHPKIEAGFSLRNNHVVIDREVYDALVAYRRTLGTF